MASTAERFLFLIQFISSHGPLDLNKISWIFWSKKECLVFFTVFLNCFQSAKLLIDLWFSRSLLQFISHQLFECLEILTIFEFFSQALSIVVMKELTAFSSNLISVRIEVLIDKMLLIKSLMNTFPSALLLAIVCFLLWICRSLNRVEMVRGAWSNDNLHSE